MEYDERKMRTKDKIDSILSSLPSPRLHFSKSNLSISLSLSGSGSLSVSALPSPSALPRYHFAQTLLLRQECQCFQCNEDSRRRRPKTSEDEGERGW